MRRRRRGRARKRASTLRSLLTRRGGASAFCVPVCVCVCVCVRVYMTVFVCTRALAGVTRRHSAQIYYCSRTHTQLAQFMGEVMSLKAFAPVRALALGSRKVLCVNRDVRKLASDARIADRCLELQDARRKKPSAWRVQQWGGGETSRRAGSGKRRTVGADRPAKGCEYLQSAKLQASLADAMLVRGTRACIDATALRLSFVPP